MRSQPQCCCRDTVTLVSLGPCQRSGHYLHSSASFLTPFKSLPHAFISSSHYLGQPAVIIIGLNRKMSTCVHAWLFLQVQILYSGMCVYVCVFDHTKRSFMLHDWCHLTQTVDHKGPCSPSCDSMLALSQSQTMNMPHMADGSSETIILVKRRNTYTGDVGILFVSLSVGFVYILAHQDILMSTQLASFPLQLASAVSHTLV